MLEYQRLMTNEKNSAGLFLSFKVDFDEELNRFIYRYHNYEFTNYFGNDILTLRDDSTKNISGSSARNIARNLGISIDDESFSYSYFPWGSTNSGNIMDLLGLYVFYDPNQTRLTLSKLTMRRIPKSIRREGLNFFIEKYSLSDIIKESAREYLDLEKEIPKTETTKKKRTHRAGRNHRRPNNRNTSK